MACAKELPFKDFTCLNVKGGASLCFGDQWSHKNGYTTL